MVRLVFRPYTRLRRSICTSESLRTSTRVSPGFVLAGHRSPSFGSQHVRSGCACPDAGKPAPFANAPGMRRRERRISPQQAQRQAFAFSAPWCLVAPRLAHMLDSLVRVSRRVGWNHNQTRRKLERTPQNRQPAAGTCAQAARQGAQSTQTTSHASAQLPPTLLAGTPRERHRPDGTRSNDNSRVADNGSPEGLETGRAPKSTPRPNLPTTSTPKRTRSQQTGKHNPRAARKPITRSREVATSY